MPRCWTDICAFFEMTASPWVLQGLSPAPSPIPSRRQSMIGSSPQCDWSSIPPSHHRAAGQDVLPVTHDELQGIAANLLLHTSCRPDIGIVLGSGLGGLGNLIEHRDTISYSQIPYFPVSTVKGHEGKLVFGRLGGKEVVCMQGRCHMYEGYPTTLLAIPVRILKLLGVHTLIVTNAAGGLNSIYDVGDFMIIKDHINLPQFAGLGPLVGPNDDRFGPRFPPMNRAYDKDLRELAVKIAEELGFDKFVREGVYICQAGPCFETVAECRMFKMLGADACGMSTVPEVVTALHCSMKVFGMSLITNKCIVDFDDNREPNHLEVLDTARRRAKDMERFIIELIRRIKLDDDDLSDSDEADESARILRNLAKFNTSLQARLPIDSHPLEKDQSSPPGECESESPPPGCPSVTITKS